MVPAVVASSWMVADVSVTGGGLLAGGGGGAGGGGAQLARDLAEHPRRRPQPGQQLIAVAKPAKRPGQLRLTLVRPPQQPHRVDTEPGTRHNREHSGDDPNPGRQSRG